MSLKVVAIMPTRAALVLARRLATTIPRTSRVKGIVATIVPVEELAMVAQVIGCALTHLALSILMMDTSGETVVRTQMVVTSVLIPDVEVMVDVDLVEVTNPDVVVEVAVEVTPTMVAAPAIKTPIMFLDPPSLLRIKMEAMDLLQR